MIIAGFIANPSVLIMVLLLPLLGSFALLYRAFYEKYREGKIAEKIDSSIRESLLDERRKVLI